LIEMIYFLFLIKRMKYLLEILNLNC